MPAAPNNSRREIRCNRLPSFEDDFIEVRTSSIRARLASTVRASVLVTYVQTDDSSY